jgi:RNA polymerase sigma factor (sigma-70 family)
MSAGLLRDLCSHVHGLALTRNGGGPPDRELLERYLSAHDEAAFAALVQRHGGMVLGACRRLLHCEHDAEDAWQATFLVLACRGRSIRQRQSLAGWLHGVACRVARKLRVSQARRRAQGGEVPEVPARDGPPDLSWQEAKAILDEEVERLPERYRAPVVLCYLEGQTRDDAARQLGWSLGTLRGRLERGRLRLRARLIRRGVTLSASLLAADLAAPAMAQVPPTLAVAAVRSAAGLTTGSSLCSVAPPRLVPLLEGVITAMCWTKWKTAIALLVLSLPLIGLTAGLFAQPTPGDPPFGARDDSRPGKGAPSSSNFDPFKKATPPDLEKRVAELEKQVARLTDELAALKKRGQFGAPEKDVEKVQEEVIGLKYIKAAEAFRLVRELFGDKGSISMAVDEKANTFFLRGTPNDLATVREIVQKIDAAGPAKADPPPVLKTFTLSNVKATEAAKVADQIFQRSPMRIVASGEKTLIVLATPEQFKDLVALIDMLEKAASKDREEDLKRERKP